MLRLPIYGNKSLMLAYEFGLILSEVAKENNIEVTRNISERAEKILINEIRTKGWRKTTLNITPLIMAALEPKENTQ